MEVVVFLFMEHSLVLPKGLEKLSEVRSNAFLAQECPLEEEM